ncbi:transcriptional regulator [Candidatus Bathyarchaeota archaeon]|nr:transcriptional regulator [Candidatus Bathyarchaeota archaeon]
MSRDFVQCSMCKTVLSEKDCAFASYKKIIDGKETFFCCERCHDDYEKNMSKRAR